MSLALSTSWNAFKFRDGRKIIKEIKDAGFDKIELGFSLDERIIQDIARFVKNKEITVVSAHNFCPIPQGFSRKDALPDCYSVASLDEEERNNAVKFTKKSIDCCARLNAKALVLHLGRVEMEDNTRVLIRLFREGGKDSPQYKKIKLKMEQQRGDLSAAYFSQALRSLEDLSHYAREKGIALGIENRFYFCEIPGIFELNKIFERFGEKKVFYWHDAGHAAIAQMLGFVSNAEDYLFRYGSKLLGMHLHDVKNGQDHLAPGSGDFDFSKLKPYINGHVLKVIEAHYPATKQEIINARLSLEKII